ncbi:hypothetical protein DFQ28_003257 [Apophysomyces sp. BC1034]|nr:hypothetical protein DFQ30_001211 [Apophysomyces sp. BC1015]KAG0189536.1 hypothetical protein DFQ28_003257 [Apophysomyces sp. BC1034]
MPTQQHLAYVLRLADNALILGQRNAEWTGHGPVLEEDIAPANISLDLIGQARLYHYYESKEAILFDLLDRYTKRLMLTIAEVEGASQRRELNEQQTFAELIRAFLAEYETSHTRHVARLNNVKYLVQTQRAIILDRQRDIVAAFARQLARAYPQRVTKANQTALTMMVFGMINWTFTWLKPGGKMTYAHFADEVVAVLERGLASGCRHYRAANRGAGMTVPIPLRAGSTPCELASHGVLHRSMAF